MRRPFTTEVNGVKRSKEENGSTEESQAPIRKKKQVQIQSRQELLD